MRQSVIDKYSSTASVQSTFVLLFAGEHGSSAHGGNKSTTGAYALRVLMAKDVMRILLKMGECVDATRCGGGGDLRPHM
jgi:hypothetical protein